MAEPLPLGEPFGIERFPPVGIIEAAAAYGKLRHDRFLSATFLIASGKAFSSYSLSFFLLIHKTADLSVQLFFCYTHLKIAEAERVMPEQLIEVIAYAGHRGEESPRAFILGGKRIEVRKIIARWVEEDAVSKRRFRCFRVKGDDFGNHLLRYDEATGDWLYSGETTDG
jgi:hypothetical protein